MHDRYPNLRAPSFDHERPSAAEAGHQYTSSCEGHGGASGQPDHGDDPEWISKCLPTLSRGKEGYTIRTRPQGADTSRLW